HDRAVAPGPAGVVGGVAEVLDAVGGELRLLARLDVPHPEVVVTDERGALPVGREDHVAAGGGAAVAPFTRAVVSRQLTAPARGAHLEADGAAFIQELEGLEGQLARIVGGI